MPLPLTEEEECRAEFWKEHWQDIQPEDDLVPAENYGFHLVRGLPVRVCATDETFVYLDNTRQSGYFWYRFEPGYYLAPIRIIMG